MKLFLEFARVKEVCGCWRFAHFRFVINLHFFVLRVKNKISRVGDGYITFIYTTTAVCALDSIQVQNPEVHWACDASVCFHNTLDPKQTSHGSHLLNKIVRIINSNDVST